jgi:hypothetical protein
MKNVLLTGRLTNIKKMLTQNWGVFLFMLRVQFYTAQLRKRLRDDKACRNLGKPKRAHGEYYQRSRTS